MTDTPRPTVTVTEVLTHAPALAFARLIDSPAEHTLDQQGLPLLWHWLYLLDRPRTSDLGIDGHPASGGILAPPAPGHRRMFGGGRVTQTRPLRLGAAATRTTWASPAINKAGRSGPITLVTLHHHTSQEGQVVITEEQDIVYRSPAAPATETASEPTSAPSPSPDQAPGQPLALNARDGASNTSWDISPVFLFRFSALTYNAHRIHYDRDYARDIEGYPGLLVHGPLQAMLMTESARCWLQQRQPGHTLRGSHELSPTTAREERPVEFSYRLISPLFDPDGLVTVADTPPPIDAQPEVRTDSTTTCVHTRAGTRDGRVTATGRLALAAH